MGVQGACWHCGADVAVAVIFLSKFGSEAGLLQILGFHHGFAPSYGSFFLPFAPPSPVFSWCVPLLFVAPAAPSVFLV